MGVYFLLFSSNMTHDWLATIENLCCVDKTGFKSDKNIKMGPIIEKMGSTYHKFKNGSIPPLVFLQLVYSPSPLHLKEVVCTPPIFFPSPHQAFPFRVSKRGECSPLWGGKQRGKVGGSGLLGIEYYFNNFGRLLFLIFRIFWRIIL